VNKMAARAFRQSSQSKNEGEDPIESARKFRKEMIADDLLESQLAESRAKRVKAEAEAKEAEARARKIASGEETGGPFQIKGGLNLGTIDLQKEREETQRRLEEAKREQDEVLKATGQENQALREKIHEMEMKNLAITFQTQMEGLQKIIERQGSQKSFIEQYTEAMETAKTLGFQMGQPAGGSSAELQLQLKKLDFDQAVTLRNLAREEKAEARKWDLELRRLDDDRKAKEAELAAAQRRDDMIASFPQAIGGAIARGVMESRGGGGAPGVASEPRGKTSHHIEAGPGESGETPCPECGEVMAIGPTARAAVCPGCGLRVPIHRTTKEPEEPHREASGERRREEE
jgi:hypothetical protein